MVVPPKGGYIFYWLAELFRTAPQTYASEIRDQGIRGFTIYSLHFTVHVQYMLLVLPVGARSSTMITVALNAPDSVSAPRMSGRAFPRTHAFHPHCVT